jgi:hypothetical protein
MLENIHFPLNLDNYFVIIRSIVKKCLVLIPPEEGWSKAGMGQFMES